MNNREIAILVVDDEAANVDVLLKILRRNGYSRVRGTSDPRDVEKIAVIERPDLVLLDLHMPALDGIEVMRVLHGLGMEPQPFVVILTGDDSPDAKARALSSGARDFITKPFDSNEVVLRIKNLADLRLMHRALHEINLGLEEKVRERTADLERARIEIIERLGLAAEFRDDATGQHTRRVGMASAAIARAMGLEDEAVTLIHRAAPLHDVGKIAIPDSILLKPGPLADPEMVVMRTHTTVGARILDKSESPLLDCARTIALTHHERWDGTGYPHGLAGPEIPLPGRIVAVADFYDALSHDRPYRKQYDREQVMDMIAQARSSHFDPAVVDAFLRVVD